MKWSILVTLIIIRIFFLPQGDIYYMVAILKDESFYSGGDFTDRVTEVMAIDMTDYQIGGQDVKHGHIVE